jgi:hypothetical protein
MERGDAPIASPETAIVPSEVVGVPPSTDDIRSAR